MLPIRSTFTCKKWKLPDMPNDFPDVIPMEYRDDPTTMIQQSGWYENPTIQAIINASFFRNKWDIGITHAPWFTPMPLVTIALVTSTIEFLIEEWNTGSFVKDRLNATWDAARFRSHLQNLEQFQADNPNRCKKLRERMTKRGRLSAGVADEGPETSRGAVLTAQDFGNDLLPGADLDSD